MAEFKACTGTKLEMCRKVNNDPAKFAVKQGNMINNLMELLCMKEAKGLNESAECFNKKTVSDSMDKCINSSTPEQDDMGNFKQESEAQQCMRIQEHNICAETAVKSNCDKETASFAARLGESILKVIYDNKGLTCPTVQVSYSTKTVTRGRFDTGPSREGMGGEIDEDIDGNDGERDDCGGVNFEISALSITGLD
ncbi:hypothetical protein FSP39_002055 [Pinctada imbricata]|uniref:Uncharacterized protein n=1 Tax=Pinctada imbricata TaxID=66713 RepID=A0AA89BKC4_PINIB|nr:hypothetical protein FSP39_002055 [Pinctada imbricata]